MSGFLTSTETDLTPPDFVSRHGRIESEFSHRTQDSGNVSWIVDSADGRLFVKTAGTDAPPPPGFPTPYFDRTGRIALLRNAVELAGSCDHPALPELRNVIETPAGPILVYEAVPGELIGIIAPGGSAAEPRADPTSAYQRFAHLPAQDQLGVFDTVIDLHRVLAGVGWIACDLYDGCLIVDFSDLTVHLVDLDTYRRGPSRNEMGRMFGSTRFMAPEEFELGAPLDQRTTVFILGRVVWHFGTRLTERAEDFCGPAEVRTVVSRAIEPRRDNRYPTVADFAVDWRAARSRS